MTARLQCANREKDIPVRFSKYVAVGLHPSTTPENPTWLYSTSRIFGYNVWLQSLCWVVLLVPLVWLLWRAASSPIQLHKLFDIHAVIKFCVIRFFYIACINCFAPWPNREETNLHRNNPAYLGEIGCIVPCHKSSDEIAETIRSLLMFLKPEHIVVVDNGNSFSPLDDTQQKIEELNPGVVYMWVPLGLKTNALWMGLNKLPSSVRYVMHIDDDTIVPHDMVFDEKVWDHRQTDAVSYGISMYQTGIVEKLVDLEFKEISQLRWFQSLYSSVWFQHGIIGIWRRDAFTAILKEHPFLPFGEDNWNGTINLLRNRQMRQELRSYVTTYAPSTLLPCTGSREQGYGAANLWKQRAERWFVNAPRRALIRLYLLFFYCHDTIVGNIVFRIMSIMHLLEIYVHLTATLSFVAWVISDDYDLFFLLQAGGIQIGFHMLQILTQNYIFWRHRPDIQVELCVCILTPFYHWFLQLCYWYGHWRCLLYYIPCFPFRHGLYTEEGVMSPDLLRKLHKIDTVPDAIEMEERSLLSGWIPMYNSAAEKHQNMLSRVL